MASHHRDFWSVLGKSDAAGPHGLHDVDPLAQEWLYLDLAVWEESRDLMNEWADQWTGEHEAILDGVQQAMGGKEHDYCCFGAVHDASVKLVGDMTQLGSRLDLARPTHEFEVSMHSDYIMLKFPDETPFAQISELLTRGLGAMDMLGTQPPVEAKAFVNTKAVHGVLQRAKKPSEAVLKVDLNIYGPRSDADSVGSVLSDNRIYLQDPEEGVAGFEYYNPHVIVFPGLEDTRRDKCNGAGADVTQADDALEQTSMRETILNVYGSLKRHMALGRTDAGLRILTPLLPHQEIALNFMIQRETGPVPEEFSLWDRVILPEAGGTEVYRHKLTGHEELNQPNELGGGILADDMGMGKSLTSLGLIAKTVGDAEAWARRGSDPDQQSAIRSSKRARKTRRSKATLIVVPSTLIMQTSWKPEIDERLDKSLRITQYYGKTRDEEQELYETSDIVFTTYHTIAASIKRPNNPMRHISWFRIILDEAHTIRRKETALFKAVSELSAKYRWCLTGTPIQNRLDDLGSLISFLRLSQLENASAFKKYVANPVREDPDKGTGALAHLMDCICLRRTRELADMPAPEENINWVKLSPEERSHYDDTVQAMMSHVRARAWERTGKGNHFGAFQVQLQLRLLCNHGTFQKRFCRQSLRDRKTARDAMLDSIGTGADIGCSGCGAPVSVFAAFGASGGGLGSSGGLLCPHRFCPSCLSGGGLSPASDSQVPESLPPPPCCPVCQSQSPGVENSEVLGPAKPEETTHWSFDGPDGYFNNFGVSSKIQALMKDLGRTSIHEKSIIFSCWTRSLNLIEAQLRRLHIRYERIDGDHSLWQRQRNMERFTKDREIRVLIMSTGVGAFGLNLTAANHIFIFEPQWNPSVERQAIGRAVRLGQSKPVVVTRYLVLGSVETAMHEQQRRKVQLARAGFEKEQTTPNAAA